MVREATARASSGRSPRAAGPQRPPYAAAGVAALAVFVLYALTLSRTTAFWDTSEYIATAHILGIPHPPGNPLFVVLARAWTVLLAPLVLSVALRVNLFSAFMSAAAHGLWFLVMHHVLGRVSGDERFRLAGAAVAVLVSATAFTVWNQSDVNEKVYTVTLFTVALLAWLALLWRERLDRGKEDNLLVLMAFVLALSVGNHLMAFLAAPAVGVFILAVRPRTLFRGRLYPAVMAAAAAGLSVHLFLPLRAGLNPVINEGDPTCPSLGSALGAVVTYGKLGCLALSDSLNRTQYAKPPFFGVRAAPLWSQITNYLQYFDWQWGRSLGGADTVFAGLRLPFTLLFGALGIRGAAAHFRRDRSSFYLMGALMFMVSAALLYYMNFKYGFSLAPWVTAPQSHEVRERDYFFVVSFSVWGLWAGLGIAVLWQEAARGLKGSLGAATPILGLAFVPLVANWSWASRAHDHVVRDWAYNLLMSVEPYGVLFTDGDNDTFPLWYLQEAEGIRRDVTVVVQPYLTTPWYAEQLRELTTPCPAGTAASEHPTRNVCQRPYTFENTGAAYVAEASRAPSRVPLLLRRPVGPPRHSALPLDDAAIERVAGSAMRVEEPQALRLGGLTVELQAGQVVYPWMYYALAMIANTVGERPVYFTSTVGTAASLGLDAHLRRQGLAYRLDEGPTGAQPPEDVVTLDPTPFTVVTGSRLDAARTRTLVDHVFVQHTGVPDRWEHWPDRGTDAFPRFYAWTYLALAQEARQRGDREAQTRYVERANAWMALASADGAGG
jgi:Protein O-mannosyl-transferase TMEM260-like